MRRIKRRTFAGCVCEQEVFPVASNRRSLEDAEPRQWFASDEERRRHNDLAALRKFTQIVNATFGPGSLYSTLTFDRAHEVHTYWEAKLILENFIKRLRRINPDAQLVVVMGTGATNRIHFHMLSNGLTKEQIADKWGQGEIRRIEPLREHNYYTVPGKAGKVDHGRDYKGLAEYLISHWTPEQGGHRYRPTRNLCKPERDKPTIVNRVYTVDKPPRAPKGYKLVEARGNQFGYLYYKYIVIPDKPEHKPKR
jgi:hypothetical protein